MHLRRIKIANIRSFEKLDVHFADKHSTPVGWIVLAGRNGVGKTTFLQSIAAAILGASSLSWLLEDLSSWIRLGTDTGSIELWLEGSAEDHRASGDLQGPFQIKVAWSRSGGVFEHPPKGNHTFVVSQFWGGAALGAQPQGWCLAGYGANRFNEPATSVAERIMKAPPRRSAVVTLFRRDASLQTANAWINEVVTGHMLQEDSTGSSKIFRHNCYWILQSLLDDGLLFEAGETTGTVTLNSWGLGIKRPEGTIPVATVGQGMEALALLVTDILRQMSRFYGENFLGGQKWMPPSEGPVIISHSGIILIDEAENHLHPQLQQRIGFWLKTHFPNVQFIVTTHSPFICQAADALFRVGNGQIEPVTGETFRRVVNGSNEEAVLTELFGLSSAWSDVSEQKRVTLANLETSALDKGVLTPKMAAQMRELAAELPGELTAQVERVIQVVQGT